MIMTTLHQITPHDRHGEAIALRSMAINLSSALMPLMFGLAGAALGAVGAVLGDGRGGRPPAASPARRIGAAAGARLSRAGSACRRGVRSGCRARRRRRGRRRRCSGAARRVGRAAPASRRSTIGVGGRVLVVRRQARLARVAGGVEVRVPDVGREAAQRLRADAQRRRVAAAGQLLERLGCPRRLSDLLSLYGMPRWRSSWRAESHGSQAPAVVYSVTG